MLPKTYPIPALRRTPLISAGGSHRWGRDRRGSLFGHRDRLGGLAQERLPEALRMRRFLRMLRARSSCNSCRFPCPCPCWCWVGAVSCQGVSRGVLFRCSRATSPPSVRGSWQRSGPWSSNAHGCCTNCRSSRLRGSSAQPVSRAGISAAVVRSRCRRTFRHRVCCTLWLFVCDQRNFPSKQPVLRRVGDAFHRSLSARDTRNRADPPWSSFMLCLRTVSVSEACVVGIFPLFLDNMWDDGIDGPTMVDYCRLAKARSSGSSLFFRGAHVSTFTLVISSVGCR